MDRIPLETSDGESAVRFRDCFSVRYLESAAVLCRLGYRIERMHQENGPLSADLRIRHGVFILNSLLSSVAFLESTVNEVYADAADDACPPGDERRVAVYRAIRDRWHNEKNFDRAPLVEKYQKIRDIAADPLAVGELCGLADIQLLVGIRNHLMHYRREWISVTEGGDGEETRAGRFERLTHDKFVENPLAEPQLPFFPDRLLGHGCAEWAVRRSLEFTDSFFSSLELPPPYDGIRDELTTR